MSSYVGIDAYGFYHAFTSKTKPTAKSHGHMYRSATGPFKTNRGAVEYARLSNLGNLVTQEQAENAAARPC